MEINDRRPNIFFFLMLVSKCITRKPRIQRARAPASLSFHCLNDMCIPKTLNIIFKTTVKISTCQGWTCCIDMSGGPDGPVGWPAGHVQYKWIMGLQRVTDASVGFKTQSAPVYSFGFHYLQNISWTLTFCLAPTGWIPLPPAESPSHHPGKVDFRLRIVVSTWNDHMAEGRLCISSLPVGWQEPHVAEQ